MSNRAEDRDRTRSGRPERRRLALDLAVAVVIAAVFVIVAPGLGVVAFFGVPILLAGLLALALGRALNRGPARRRRGRARRRRVPRPR